MNIVFPHHKGFSLVELLVVISIIGILAAAAIASLGDARESAKEVSTTEDLRQLARGVTQLMLDTRKAPNGCPYAGTANPEARLDSTQAGLLERPNPQVYDSRCEWTTFDISRWDGPYATVGTDIWGNPYWYDPDYVPYRNCPGTDELPVIQAVVSRGADYGWYTCDDVYLEI